MRIRHSWIGKTLIALVALACTEGILYDPLCWSDSLGNQLDWAASHAVIKPMPSFRSLSGLKTKAHSMVSALQPSKIAPELTPPQESPQVMAAVADSVKSPAKATPKHNEPLSDLRPLPKTYQASSVLESPKAPEAPKGMAAPVAPTTPAIAVTPTTPAMDPALMQQMMLMTMLGNGGLNGNNGGNNATNTDPTTAMMNSMMGGDSNNNSNGFNPTALMQLMQMQQANPAGSPNGQQNMDPEMIQTMLMGQLMNNMDFTGSNKSNDDR
ncbi:MAG: hypothetical protein QE263_09510 [Vampirovibrionales bacterium]|nr:hypothetical protein [Vampirovibrionales bacterium]